MNRGIEHAKLCADIEVALSARGVLTTRNPSGIAHYNGAKVPYGAFSAPTEDGRFGGGPDIIAITRGSFVAIEAKTGDAVTTKAQVACRKRIERAGAKYVVARTVADAVEACGCR